MTLKIDKEKVLERLSIPALCRELIPSLKATGSKGEALARCPWPEKHNNGDATPSFTINTGTGAFCCKACGEKGGIVNLCMKVWGTDFKATMQELGRRAGIVPPENIKQRVTGRYDYHDKWGNLLYWKERLEPGPAGRSKEFRFYHGNRQTGRGGEPLLYHLPDVNKAKSVIITEGEKQADLLQEWGLVGTSLDSGAQSKPTPEQINHLIGKRIAILRDNDKAGLTYALTLANALHGKCERLKVVLLPGLPDKGDLCDWKEEPGNDKARLLAIIKAAPEWEPGEIAPEVETTEPEEPAKRLRVVTIHELLQTTFPERDSLLHPVIQTQSLTMIHAWRGLGKTHVGLGIAYAVASGGNFLKWEAPQPRGVLYLDGEMPGNSLQERLAAIVAASDKEPLPDYFKIITPDLQEPGGVPDLSTVEGQAALDAMLTDETALIVVDNISCLCRTGRENEAESWIPVQGWALRQRAAGRSVLFIHHSGKNGEQRGASKREDILDTVIKLKRPVDYEPNQGAVFEVIFEKARHLMGEDAASFEARLTTDPVSGLQEWVYKDVAQSNFDRVVELANEGLSQAEIANEIQINKSNVSRHYRRAVHEGLIPKK